MARARVMGRLPAPPTRKSNFWVIDVSELAATPKERKLSPRQIEALARQKTINDLLNEAAAQPASKAVAWDFGKQSSANVRNALNKVIEREPRDLKASIRGSRLIVSKGKLPGRTTWLGRRKAKDAVLGANGI
jgi:hypothetical protein